MIGGVCGVLDRRMIPRRAVSEDTINKAKSFAVILGPAGARGGTAMDEILASYSLGNGGNLHIATLSRNTIVTSGAEHLGYGGYFVFETCDLPGSKGLTVLGKASSLEAAFRLIDLWAVREPVAA
jgi:hypothetical protein